LIWSLPPWLWLEVSEPVTLTSAFFISHTTEQACTLHTDNNIQCYCIEWRRCE